MYECLYIRYSDIRVQLKPLMEQSRDAYCIDTESLQIQLKQVVNIEYTFYHKFLSSVLCWICDHLAVSLILQVQPSVCLGLSDVRSGCVGLCGHLAVSLILQVQPSVCCLRVSSQYLILLASRCDQHDWKSM